MATIRQCPMSKTSFEGERVSGSIAWHEPFVSPFPVRAVHKLSERSASIGKFPVEYSLKLPRTALVRR